MLTHIRHTALLALGLLFLTLVACGGSNPTATSTVASYASDYSTNKTYKEDLARHLTSVGAVMYGAYWCPHCKRQKTMFGDGFKSCTPDPVPDFYSNLNIAKNQVSS